ncbi:hypothetical protein [Kurthia massiliensis]|uniref:hypothetical protein n=1 Tax=Kurthia massiliensis TaxID=1033739 RepID=UPI0002890F67|nr:hypothetical protein [Kurthia massiliensis]
MPQITAFDFILKTNERLHFDADDFRMIHFGTITDAEDEQIAEDISVFLYRNANQLSSYVTRLDASEPILPFERIQQTADIAHIQLTYDDDTNAQYRIGWHADAQSNQYQTSIVHPRSGDLLLTISAKQTVTQQFREVLMP